ncbi:MAG: PTS system mannose/fructose/sorbose family transporter subunit IID [Hungatella sp.]|jgi:fructoselysine and glucoselysine-specific PTS system IID component|nr:PTS system mannose/fructose/sorbose family transporter subunit IID [Hungatella sp.]
MKISKDGSGLTDREWRAIFLRSLTMEVSWNYERQQNMGYCFSMLPAIRKLYEKKEDQIQAAKRHMEYFNTTPYVSTAVLGISAAMEEENAKNREYDPSSINHVKTALMGPLAGIGDTMLWGTLRVVATGIGVSLALKGSLLGAVLFWLIFNIPAYSIRYLCLKRGYTLKTDFLDNIWRSGVMPKVSSATTVISLMVMGAMVFYMVSVPLAVSWGDGSSLVQLQGVLDEMVPGFLPLAVTLGIYGLLRRKMNLWQILLILTACGIAGTFLGMFHIL